MVRRALLLLPLVIAALTSSATAQAWRLGPDLHSVRHPIYSSIEILDTRDLPVFRFYERSDLTGMPAVVLDEKGLTVDSVLRCKWIERYARVLAEIEDKGRAEQLDPICPTAVPISTKRTDAGRGPYIALYIAVGGIKGTVGRMRVGSRTLYFDLRTVPGDPDPEAETHPPFTLPTTGVPRWTWLDSQRIADRKEGATLEKRLRNQAFAAFYHGIRACLMGRDPTCLTQYLDPSFRFTSWWGAGPETVDRRAFARYAWGAAPEGSEGESLWQQVAWCFLRGRFHDQLTELQFSRGFFFCNVRERDGRFGVFECDVSE